MHQGTTPFPTDEGLIGMLQTRLLSRWGDTPGEGYLEDLQLICQLRKRLLCAPSSPHARGSPPTSSQGHSAAVAAISQAMSGMQPPGGGSTRSSTMKSGGSGGSGGSSNIRPTLPDKAHRAHTDGVLSQAKQGTVEAPRSLTLQEKKAALNRGRSSLAVEKQAVAWAGSLPRTITLDLEPVTEESLNKLIVELDAPAPDDPEDDVRVIVGPSELATGEQNISSFSLPEDGNVGSKQQPWIPIQSNERVLCLSDVLRLGKARSMQAPLSFGSVIHLLGHKEPPCRPCMYEHWPGRCKKSWLCDFCHCPQYRKKYSGQGAGSGRASDHLQYHHHQQTQPAEGIGMGRPSDQNHRQPQIQSALSGLESHVGDRIQGDVIQGFFL